MTGTETAASYTPLDSLKYLADKFVGWAPVPDLDGSPPSGDVDPAGGRAWRDLAYEMADAIMAELYAHEPRRGAHGRYADGRLVRSHSEFPLGFCVTWHPDPAANEPCLLDEVPDGPGGKHIRAYVVGDQQLRVTEDVQLSIIEGGKE